MMIVDRPWPQPTSATLAPRQPLAQIALVDVGRRGQFGRGHRAPGVQRLVEPERGADPHQCDARGAADIRQHLSDKLMQFRVVDHVHLPC
jgi:hypothetical protein